MTLKERIKEAIKQAHIDYNNGHGGNEDDFIADNVAEVAEMYAEEMVERQRKIMSNYLNIRNVPKPVFEQPTQGV